ncbi:MAG: hypothetical protein OJI67_22530, partial [Prosthecobacter sp.]|nr:hypothetical protein [Prosthecobacter sp.]
MIASLLLLTVLVVFHRPIILSLIRWAGPKAAAKFGVPLSWQVTGSIWNDFKLTDIEAGGGEEHWLPTAKIGEISTNYDWRALLKGDYEHSVNQVTLHDVEAEVDLR